MKRGLDTIDQMMRNYSCKAMIQKFPTVLRHKMLDIFILNIFTIFKALQPNYKWGVAHAKRLFIKKLTKQLVVPFIGRWHDNHRSSNSPKKQY